MVTLKRSGALNDSIEQLTHMCITLWEHPDNVTAASRRCCVRSCLTSRSITQYYESSHSLLTQVISTD